MSYIFFEICKFGGRMVEDWGVSEKWKGKSQSNRVVSWARGRRRERGTRATRVSREHAHGRRKFRDAEATRPDLAAEGGAFIAAMYVAEQDAQARGLVGAKLRAHRQRRIAPIVKRFRRWLDAVAPTLLPSEPLADPKSSVRRRRKLNRRDVSVPGRDGRSKALTRRGSLFALAPLRDEPPAPDPLRPG